MQRVDILLATYNGELYLREQIDSILSQSYSDWRLIVRDDGSTDQTLRIVRDYTDPRITIVSDSIRCGSAQANFMELLKHSTAEFVCFCDQDDIWVKDKLQQMVNLIERKDNTQPYVIFSDGYLYYGKKNEDLPRLLNARPKNLKDQLFCNGGLHGSMSMFNAQMRQKMLRPIEFVAMHDHLLTLLGVAFDGIDYLEKPTFYYRQHQNNVTPHVAGGFFKRLWMAFFKNHQLPVIDARHYKGVEAFFDAHRSDLPADGQRLCKLYLSYPERNAAGRFWSIVKNGFSLNNSRMNLYLKILLRKYQ